MFLARGFASDQRGLDHHRRTHLCVVSQTQLALPGGFVARRAVIALVVLVIGLLAAHSIGLWPHRFYAIGGNETRR